MNAREQERRRKQRREFIDSLGRERVQRRLGLKSPSAITNAIFRGLPAGWLPPIEAMCAEDGRECPRHLFNVRRADAA